MGVEVAGLVVLVVFYVVILVVGVFAARRKQRGASLETSIVADRDINTLVGVFTMTATIVGGGYVNGSAESVAKDGIAWTLSPFGIFLGLIIGTSLSVILNINLNVAIVTSAAVTVLYTMVGQMISVAYTDIVQLCFIVFGLILSIPFVFTSDKVGQIEETSSQWLGAIETGSISPWIDLFIAMASTAFSTFHQTTFGTIPWQSYFQRVLSVKSGNQARALSIAGAFCSLILVIPPAFIGAASTVADWNQTNYGMSPVDNDQGSMVLPLMLQEFTPAAVSIIGLGAISAAVMSSMDSSILGSSSMLTYNVYKQLIRPEASETELLWLQRAAILILGAIATVVSTSVHIIYGLFVLAGDIVSVIVFPQLTAALFLRFTNAYGALTGLILSLILRLGAGEPNLNFDYFIYYPWYDDEAGQIFPFRVFAMIISFLAIITISFLTNFLFRKGLLSQKFDVMRCSVNGTQPNSQQEQNKSPTTNDDFIRNNYTTSYL